MPIFVLILEIIFLLSCNHKSEEKKTQSLNKGSDDKFMAIRLLDFNDTKYSSLILRDDTMFIITSSNFKTSKENIVRDFFYDLSSRTFQFNYSTGDQYVTNINGSSAKNFSFYLKSIGNPKISYSNIPAEVRNKIQILKTISEHTKFQLFEGRYYFIDLNSPTDINVYNPSTGKLDSFAVANKLFEAIGFFLYDFDRDGNPEILILNIGRIPRDDIISYSIYSIRKDSVSINFK